MRSCFGRLPARVSSTTTPKTAGEHAEILRNGIRPNDGRQNPPDNYPEENPYESQKGFGTERVSLLVAIHKAGDAEGGGDHPDHEVRHGELLVREYRTIRQENRRVGLGSTLMGGWRDGKADRGRPRKGIAW